MAKFVIHEKPSGGEIEVLLALKDVSGRIYLDVVDSRGTSIRSLASVFNDGITVYRNGGESVPGLSDSDGRLNLTVR